MHREDSNIQFEATPDEISLLKAELKKRHFNAEKQGSRKIGKRTAAFAKKRVKLPSKEKNEQVKSKYPRSRCSEETRHFSETRDVTRLVTVLNRVTRLGLCKLSRFTSHGTRCLGFGFSRFPPCPRRLPAKERPTRFPQRLFSKTQTLTKVCYC